MGQYVLCTTLQLTGTVCANWDNSCYFSAFWDSQYFVLYFSLLGQSEPCSFCTFFSLRITVMFIVVFILFNLPSRLLVRRRACHPTSVKIGAMAPSCVKISENQIQNCLFVLSFVHMRCTIWAFYARELLGHLTKF